VKAVKISTGFEKGVKKMKEEAACATSPPDTTILKPPTQSSSLQLNSEQVAGSYVMFTGG